MNGYYKKSLPITQYFRTDSKEGLKRINGSRSKLKNKKGNTIIKPFKLGKKRIRAKRGNFNYKQSFLEEKIPNKDIKLQTRSGYYSKLSMSNTFSRDSESEFEHSFGYKTTKNKVSKGIILHNILLNSLLGSGISAFQYQRENQTEVRSLNTLLLIKLQERERKEG